PGVPELLADQLRVVAPAGVRGQPGRSALQVDLADDVRGVRARVVAHVARLDAVPADPVDAALVGVAGLAARAAVLAVREEVRLAAVEQEVVAVPAILVAHEIARGVPAEPDGAGVGSAGLPAPTAVGGIHLHVHADVVAVLQRLHAARRAQAVHADLAAAAGLAAPAAV